jgi:hypothetical protein
MMRSSASTPSRGSSIRRLAVALIRTCARSDWRAWTVLAWVLWWGWAYCLMVVRARSFQLSALFHAIWK